LYHRRVRYFLIFIHLFVPFRSSSFLHAAHAREREREREEGREWGENRPRQRHGAACYVALRTSSANYLRNTSFVSPTLPPAHGMPETTQRSRLPAANSASHGDVSRDHLSINRLLALFEEWRVETGPEYTRRIKQMDSSMLVPCIRVTARYRYLPARIVAHVYRFLIPEKPLSFAHREI